MEVLGPGGGNITEELRSQAPAFPSFAPPRVGPPMANGAAAPRRAAPCPAAKLLPACILRRGVLTTPRGRRSCLACAGSAPAGANSSEAAAVEEPTGGLAILDSGATYTHLPRPAWEAFQKLVTSAVAARGPKLKQVVNRPSATCWEGLPADALTKDAIALAASFPDVQLRFKVRLERPRGAAGRAAAAVATTRHACRCPPQPLPAGPA